MIHMRLMLPARMFPWIATVALLTVSAATWLILLIRKFGRQREDMPSRWVMLPTIHADPGQITQLFQNLISNAVKFRG